MSTVAERVATHRKRRRAGIILLVIEANEDALVRALTDAGLIDPTMVDDHEHITRAAQRFIEIIATEKYPL
jgi:hypothetical protein